MNGRVYDPSIGKFLSADPFIQFPESTQGFNRYAYVGNNPLSANDPSGHFVQFILAAKMMAAGGAIAASGTLMMAQSLYSAAQGYQQGGFSGLIGNVVMGGVSASFSFGIGSGFEAAFGTKLTFMQLLGKSMLHGISQGIMSSAGGGRFGDGFLGGFAGGLTEGINLPKGPAGIIVAASLGGTVSKIGGGKFASGALSAAFVRAFNSDLHTTDAERTSSLTVAIDKVAIANKGANDCKVPVIGVINELKPPSLDGVELGGMQADALIDVLRAHADQRTASSFVAQSAANRGFVVIPVSQSSDISPTEEHGHLAVVKPGAAHRSRNYRGIAPNAMQSSKSGNEFNGGSLSFGFAKPPSQYLIFRRE